MPSTMFFYYLFLLLLVNSYIEKWGRTIHLVIFKTRLWWQNNVIIFAIIDSVSDAETTKFTFKRKK